MGGTVIPSGKSLLIGPYRVQGSLGAGGMAEVFQVEDTRNGKVRALKMHFAPTAESSVVLAYRREQRAIARCDHPNIVRVFDFGLHENRPYIVTEFVDGLSLGAFIKKSGLEPGPRRDSLVCKLAVQIASALDHVHSHNLVHRDVKPENILVTRDEIVKLIDFGIARDLGQDFGEVLGEGDVVGTYAYCSPEQVSGVAVDHRSDLYSFGIVLYEMVAGHLPFVAEQAIAFILKHVNDPPAPIEEYYPHIPGPLRDLILKLLEKNPLERPQSGRDIFAALREFLDTITKEVRLPTESDEEPAPTKSAPATPIRLYEPAFIGRHHELMEITDAIARLQRGSGSVVLVEGEIGIGKSRLMDQALAAARTRGLAVFTVRCMPEADRPFQPIVDLVELMLNQWTSRNLDILAQKLGPYVSILGQAFPPVGALLQPAKVAIWDASAKTELERIRAALRAFIDAVLTGPAIVALKDLQWADHATMSLISSLYLDEPGVGSTPVLWLGSVATDELRDDHIIRAWLSSPPAMVRVISVWPLSIDEVNSQIHSMLGGNLSLGSLARDLHREARGNPLFVAETIRGLIDRGSLRPHHHTQIESSGWVYSLPSTLTSSETALSNAILKTLADRLVTLTEDGIQILEYMAILARPCSFEWLRYATHKEENALLDTIDDLLARRILVERKGNRTSIFSFYHPKMGEVIRGKLSAGQRRMLHRQVAEYWIAVNGNSDMASLELLSSQYYMARDHIQATPYLVLAAEDRLRLGLNEPAKDLLEKALECCAKEAEIDERLRATVHLRLGFVLQQIGELDAAWQQLRSAYQQSLDRFPDLTGQTLFALARLSIRQGDFVASCKHFAEALKIQRACQDGPGMLRSLNGLAGSLWYLSDLSHARTLFEESETLARRLNESGLLAQAINGRGLVSLHEGKLDAALRDFMEASILSRGAGDAFYLLCQIHESDVRRMQGDLATARSQTATVVERLERIGDRDAIVTGLIAQAAVALEIYDLERADRLLERAGDFLQQSNHQFSWASQKLLQGRILMARGQFVAAQAPLREALNVAQANQYRELTDRTSRFFAVAMIRSGSQDDGIFMLERSIVDAKRIHCRPGVTEGEMFLAEVNMSRGNRSDAARLLRSCMESCRDMGMRLALHRATVLFGRLLFDAGNYPEAKTLIDRNLSWVKEIRLPLSAEERTHFDSRPDIELLGALWRSLHNISSTPAP